MKPRNGKLRLVAASVAVGLASALSVSPVGAQQEGPTYIVQPGDTLSAIARTFGTSVDALVEANSIADPSSIFPGQELIIPGYPGVTGVLGTRSLSSGETLASVSLKHGLSLETLARLNRVVNPSRMVIGSRLILPEGVATPLAMGASARQYAVEGSGLLEFSARNTASPWMLYSLNRLADRVWLLPDELLHLPSPRGATNALPPSVEYFDVQPLPLVQGQTAVVELGLTEPRPVDARLGLWDLNLIQAGRGRWIALQGIHALAEPTLIDLEFVVYGTEDGKPLDSFTQPLLIVQGDYGFEALRVPEETLDPAITDPEDELIGAVVGNTTPERRWEGAFRFPTSYFETFQSFFGTRRSYNGSAYSYYHTGLDLYGSSSTPIMAPARGVVAFADSLTVRGNATYIDHGWGVYSGYLHQSQILVEVGDQVEAGEVIGYVGGTGRATGPHLHWEIWVGGVPVNPIEWTAREIPEAYRSSSETNDSR